MVQRLEPWVLPCFSDTKRKYLSSLVYQCMTTFPKVGTRWLNFVLAPSVLVPLPILLLVAEQYKRAVLDD